MTGPVISTALYDAATLDLSHEIEVILVNTSRGLAMGMADRLRKAYLAGLRDGFAQGVASSHYEPESS